MTAVAPETPSPRLMPIGEGDRRQFLGASDVAAVLGLSKFRSPLMVYHQKRGTAPELIPSPAMEWGNRLEDSVRQAYADKMLAGTGRIVLRGAVDIERVIHPTEDWQVCSPDGIVCGAEGNEYPFPGARWLYGLEVKTADRAVAHLWGEPGTDQVPDDYALQCHWSMYVTGLRRWDVAVLIGGNDFRVYSLEYDEEMMDAILPELESFWFANVLAGVPPEASSADNDFLSKLLKQSTDELITSDDTVTTLAVALREAKSELKERESEVDEIEARLKAIIGHRAGAEGPGYRILWKNNRDSNPVDWQAVAKAMGASPEVIAAHTSTKAGARPFKATFAGLEG